MQFEGGDLIPTKKKYPSQEYQNIKGTKRTRLIAERKKIGFSQSQLAFYLGVSLSTVGKLESGRSRPGLDVWLKLQHLYGLTYETLFPDL